MYWMSEASESKGISSPSVITPVNAHLPVMDSWVSVYAWAVRAKAKTASKMVIDMVVCIFFMK
jgi:hypothetical protein